MTYIPKECEKNLHLYKYGGADLSLVSRYILTPYWNALVKLFPLWIAPNLITLSGLLCIAVNITTLFYYAPDLGTCPNWVYYTFGIGLFVYQSLDAIDGKQARRTGASGPLGELFDHGCDALNTTLGVMTWASSTSLGQSWWTVASLTASLGNFYLSTWEEYHTGILYLGYFSGPVEGVLMLVGVHLLSGYYGPEFWTQPLIDVLPLSGLGSVEKMGLLQLNHILILIGGVVMLGNIVIGLTNVIRVKCKPTEYSRKGDDSITKALCGLVPFLYFCALSYTWMRLWPDLVSEHLSVFMIFLGLLFGHQVGHMIVAHVAKLDFPYFNKFVCAMLGSGCLLAYYESDIQSVIPIHHVVVLRSYLAVALAVYVAFILSVIQQICTYLDIGCLYIKHKTKKTTPAEKQ